MKKDSEKDPNPIGNANSIADQKSLNDDLILRRRISSPSPNNLIVVGIGASAGGLEALQLFF